MALDRIKGPMPPKTLLPPLLFSLLTAMVAHAQISPSAKIGAFVCVNSTGVRQDLEQKTGVMRSEGDEIIFDVPGERSSVRFGPDQAIRCAVLLKAGSDPSVAAQFFRYAVNQGQRELIVRKIGRNLVLKPGSDAANIRFNSAPMGKVFYTKTTNGPQQFFALTEKSPLQPGEYCFGTTGSAEVYCFGINSTAINAPAQQASPGSGATASQKQQPTAPSQQSAVATKSAMTNADVIKLVSSGISSDVIIAAIRQAAERAFDLSVDGLIDLKNNKVPNAVIAVMQQPTLPAAGTVPAAPDSQPTQSAEAAGGPSPRPAASPTRTPDSPRRGTQISTAPAPTAAHTPDVKHAYWYAFDGNGGQYNRCTCTEGLCPIYRQGVTMLLNRQGLQPDGKRGAKFPIPGCVEFHDGLALMPLKQCMNGPCEYGYFDQRLNIAFPQYKFTYATPFKDGVARIGLNDGTGRDGSFFMDRQGHLTRYEGNGCSEIFEGFCSHSVGNSTEFLDLSGKPVFKLDGIITLQHFSDGMVWVESNPDGDYRKWGAVDKTGKLLVPFIYNDSHMDFSDGLAAVADRNGRWGFIDKSNNMRIPLTFFGVIAPFRNGHAIVQTEQWYAGVAPKKQALIDKTGTVLKDLTPLEFLNCNRGDGLCSFHANPDYQGICDREGNILIPAKSFKNIGEFGDGLNGLAWATMVANAQTFEGYINIKGDFVVIKGQSQF